MLGVGSIRAFDAETGRGEIFASDGRTGWFDREISAACSIFPKDVGRRVSFQAMDGFHVLRIERLMLAGWPTDPIRPWPDFGELARLICQVVPGDPRMPYRFLSHPDLPFEVLLKPKRGGRPDLRTGDKVIAEIMRWSKGPIAIKAVRLPKDYQSKMETHAPLLSVVPSL